MEVKLKHQITQEIILTFNCDIENIIIKNNDYNCQIIIKISKDNYDYLKQLNYVVSFENTQIMYSPDQIVEEGFAKQQELTNNYYVNFPLLSMNDDMSRNFSKKFNNIFEITHYPSHELAHVAYMDKHNKTKNIDLLIDDKMIDRDKTISQEKLIYK